MRIFQRLSLTLNAEEHTKKMLNGRQHIVVPTVMIVDGVLNGSNGPGFYGPEENSKNVGAWDHIPLPVYHPTVNGEFVSAKNPDIVDKYSVGLTFNTRYEDGKLKTECWFDEEKTKAVDKRVYDAIVNKKSMEVSTGLFLEQVKQKGVFNQSEYEWVAKNYKPDHLAILPDKLGACSVAQGAGLFANEFQLAESTSQSLHRAIANAVKSIGVETITGNQLSFSQISRTLNDLLSSKFGEAGKYWEGYVVEVYSNYVVFYDKEYKLYAIEYTTTDTAVTLKGDAVSVSRVVKYVTESGKSLIGNESNSLVMENEEMAIDKKKLIDSLIANAESGYDEGDRAFLEKKSDTALEKLAKVTTVPVVNEEKKVETPPPVIPVVNKAEVSQEQILASLPKDWQEVYNHGKISLENARNGYIGQIMANTANVFTKEALATKSLDELAAIAKLAGATVVVPSEQTNNGMFLNGFRPDHANYGAMSGGYSSPNVNMLESEPDVPSSVESYMK